MSSANVDTARLWCEEHLSRGGSLQRDGRTWLCSNPTREDRNPSLSADLEKRVWHDFATGEAGTLSQLADMLGCEAPAWEAEESREGKIPPARAEAGKSDEAARLWRSAKPAQQDHPYLVKKRVAPHGCREILIGGERVLLVPAYSEQGTLAGCERIWPDGQKMHLGQKAGAFLFLGELSAGRPVAIAEGFATAAAIHEFTGLPTVCAFGAGNVPTIAKRLRERYPDIELVAATDADPAGEKAAAECPAGTLAVIPSGAIAHCDWCDVAVELGREEAARQFEQKLTAARGKAPLQSAKKTRFAFTTVTAAELSTKKLPAVRWAVPGVLAEGLTVLGGPPKLGKSIFALHIGQAVASGGLALSSVEVEQGSVLYLALEDTARRIQDRLMSSGCAPEKLVFPTDAEGRLLRDAPKIGEGLEEALQEWIDRTPDARMIIIDTFQKVRPKKGRGTDAYEEDYRCIAALKALADKNGVAILLVHHTRKGTAGEPEKDFLESLLGSQAIAGSADSVLVMTRARGDNAMALSLTGRDIEERVLAMTVDFEHMTYKLEGDAAQVAATGAKKEILAVLNASKTPVSRKDIGELTGMKLNTLKGTLRRMSEARVIRVIQDGEYRGYFEVIPREENLSSSGDSDNGCVSVPDVPLYPMYLCTRVPESEPDTAIQTDTNSCTRDKVGDSNGLEGIGYKGTKGTIIDPNPCTREETGDTKNDTPSEGVYPGIDAQELESLFADATPDEGSFSRGFPIDAVPADVVLPCLVDDGSGRERWLLRVDRLGNGRRLFHTSRSKSGRSDWSFEEPVGKGAAA